MAVVLALASALTWGASDFAGGLTARRVGPYAATVGAQVAGGVALVALIAVLPGSSSGAAWFWGALSGIGGGLGLACYMRALSRGPMSLVSPTAAAVGAAIPVAVGLALGERPGAFGLAGAVLAVVAIALVCWQGRTGRDAARAFLAVLPITLLSAVGFGGFFVALSFAPADSGLWPLVAARAASVPLLVAAGRATGRRASVRGALALTIVTGVGDMAANALYLLAVREGLLSLTAALASLYPVPTIILAGAVLRERLGAVQWIGIALALVAAVLVAT